MSDRFALLVCVVGLVIIVAGISNELRSDRGGQTASGDTPAERVVLPIEYVYFGRSQDGDDIRSAVLSASFVCNLDQAGIQELAPRVVDQLALLLEDHDYAYHAATVLGCIGPPAVAAIPALERALANEERSPRPSIIVQPHFQLDFALRSALAKIANDP